jgi:FtsH-binding integral membrane protein
MPPLATETIAPAREEQRYFVQAFAWMAAGLGVTGLVSGAIGSDSAALHALFEGSSGRWVFIVCILLEFALVAGLVGLVQHTGLFETAATFIAYAALNGLTLRSSSRSSRRSRSARRSSSPAGCSRHSPSGATRPAPT